MELPPIINPQNPYVGTLRLFPGTLVKVYCRPRPNASRFAINFQTGPSLNPRDDLALHLSPCFNPPRLIRNSLQGGQWGLEESWGNGSIITPHQSFEFIVLVEPDKFKIALNGSHYCEFKHRMPFEHVSHLSIDGDVDIERIHVHSQPYSGAANPTHGGYQPSAPPTSTGPPYPVGAPNMPMPSMYPSLDPTRQSGPYPTMPTAAPYPMPPPGGVAGPTPTGTSYLSGPPGGYAQPSAGSYPQAAPYPSHAGGPVPTGSSYQGGYPNLPQQQYPQGPYPSASSSSGPFGMGGKALGTLAGLGLGAAAGAAVLSAVNPLKQVKKIMKPKKMFKGGGFGRSSSSSSSSSSRSNSSRGSFSSNSS